MVMVDDMPDDLSRQLTQRHPTYRWKLQAIVLNPAEHRKWKNLARWEPEERAKAMAARRSLCWQYGDTPLILGYEFATTTNVDGSWLAVFYDPGLTNEEAQAEFFVNRELVLAENRAKRRAKDA